MQLNRQQRRQKASSLQQSPRQQKKQSNYDKKRNRKKQSQNSLSSAMAKKKQYEVDCNLSNEGLDFFFYSESGEKHPILWVSKRYLKIDILTHGGAINIQDGLTAMLNEVSRLQNYTFICTEALIFKMAELCNISIIKYNLPA